jgi:outer membrane protein TolC
MMGSILLAIALTSCTSPGNSRLGREQEKRVDRMMQNTEQTVALSEQSHDLQMSGTEMLLLEEGDTLLAPVRLDETRDLLAMPLDSLWAAALQYSPQIRVFADLPLIRKTGIQEAEGQFDFRLFAEGSYADRDDPVGSTLTTERFDRFLETEQAYSAGVDKKLSTGGEIYLRQEFNRLSNNSEYTIPNPQWESRSVVGVVQPLLRGAGGRYNKGLMAVAALDAEIAEKEFERQVQQHLVEISRSYWSLYMARGITASKRRAVEDAVAILEELEAREELDARQTEIQRARASAADRRASLIRSETAVLNATERLRTLVNHPDMMGTTDFEFIPEDLPELTFTPFDPKEALQLALENRSEIQQAYKQLQASVIRRELSAHELKAGLNVFAEAYLAGLSDEDYNEAWDDQSDDGPGYLVGLRFEVPLGNDRAQAVNERRRLEQRQLENQLRTTMETVLLDMRIAMREVSASFREMKAAYTSLQAAREDLDNIQSRKEAKLLGGEGDAVTELTLLLGAQERRLQAEQAFLFALSTYNVALDSLKQAQGTLLQDSGIMIAEGEVDPDDAELLFENRKLPTYNVEMDRPGTASAE